MIIKTQWPRLSRLSTAIFMLLISILPIPSVAADEVRHIAFPVNGPHTLTDSFGDPRSGGRTHEGIDIMAAKMTPLVSAVNGTVTSITIEEHSWGFSVYIRDADRYSYHYLHINNDTPGTDDGQGGAVYAFPPTIYRGAKVVAGQLVGWVGDSGNAEGTASHLHFEIHRPDGSVIDPYPSLVTATQAQVPATTFQFTKDLELGDRDQDVYQLQKYLNQNGFIVATSGAGSTGNETTYFGSATQAALIKFQQTYDISPANGYFGPITRSFVNQGTAAGEPMTSGPQAGWLVKNKLYNEVFFADENLTLHWIINEAAAEKHFGPTWNQVIREYDDLGIFHLRFGENLI